MVLPSPGLPPLPLLDPPSSEALPHPASAPNTVRPSSEDAPPARTLRRDTGSLIQRMDRQSNSQICGRSLTLSPAYSTKVAALGRSGRTVLDGPVRIKRLSALRITGCSVAELSRTRGWRRSGAAAAGLAQSAKASVEVVKDEVQVRVSLGVAG